MSCPDCNKPNTYNFNCPACCARLALSARPSGKRQKGVLEWIARNNGADAALIMKEVERLKEGGKNNELC